MKNLLFALIGYLAALVAIQWFTLRYLKEPYVIRYDGGMEEMEMK